MAKESKKQAAVKPEGTPASETVQNPAETEVRQDDVIIDLSEETVQNPPEAEVRQGNVFIDLSEETVEEERPAGVQIIVVKRFKDKFDHQTIYTAGQELTFDEERADDLVNRGLAKYKGQ